MCHKKITIIACSCVLRNHLLCPHSLNLIVETSDNTTQGNSQSTPQDSMHFRDQINDPGNATTAREGIGSKDNTKPVTASQNNSGTPTITLKVSTPPPSPDGTPTPLNAGASPFAPSPSPLGQTSAPFGQTSSIGATASSPAIHAPLNVDTPSRSTTNSPSATVFYTPMASAGPSSTNRSSFGAIFTPTAPGSSLTLPVFGHSTSTSANASSSGNGNLDGYQYRFVAPTTGNSTPSAIMYTPVSFVNARQQGQARTPAEATVELSKITLSELRTNPSARTPLPTGFYPRHPTSAQRHVSWNEWRIEWVDCVAFYSTHIFDLPHMTKEEKIREHQDCPEYFGDQDVVVVQLGLCKECQGYHYEVAARGEAGVSVVEWGRVMAVANAGGLDSGSTGRVVQGYVQTQSQGQGQSQGGGQQQNQNQQQNQAHGHCHGQGQQQSQNHQQQPGMGSGQGHTGHQQHYNSAQTQTPTHSQNTVQTQADGQHGQEDDAYSQFETTPELNPRDMVDKLVVPRIRPRMGQTWQSQSQNQPDTTVSGQQHQHQQHQQQLKGKDADGEVGEKDSDEDGDDVDGQAPTVESYHGLVDRFLRRIGLPMY